MADTAAHLVDRVLPEAPVRQWVLSLPHPLRFLLGYDRRLCTAVLNTFVGTLLGWYRRRGREWLGFTDGQSGTVTAIQRFDSALRLNLHFHALALDGVYAETTGPGAPVIRFHALPPPENEEVAALLAVVSRRILRVLERRGRLRRTEDGYEVVAREEWASEPAAPALESCQAASVRGRIALGPRAGARVERTGDRVEIAWIGEVGLRPRCAAQDGFSLHGDVEVGPHDRRRLERLCRYILRPAIATERLRERGDGRIAYRGGDAHFPCDMSITMTGPQAVSRMLPMAYGTV